jgi:hypothetical protein
MIVDKKVKIAFSQFVLLAEGYFLMRDLGGKWTSSLLKGKIGLKFGKLW